MSNEQKREWDVLGAELAELNPVKYAAVLGGLRDIAATGRCVTAADLERLLSVCVEPRLHA